MTPKEQTVCFTGHRFLPEADRDKLLRTLPDTLLSLIGQGFTRFLAGGALGFDTLAAECVLMLKRTHPEVRLELLLPCRDQTAHWKNRQDISRYNAILQRADQVSVLSEHYYNGCMQVRNRMLVQSSSLCVCYLTKPTGGTAQTVAYAQKQGCRVLSAL